MQLLLDTEALLWALEKDARLSSRAETAILTTEDVFISPVSFFEIAIKLKISRKIRFSRPIVDLVMAAQESGFVWLPMSEKYLSAYDLLPFHDQHRDPFDRMILSTALADGLTVVSSDHNFALYRDLVETLW